MLVSHRGSVWSSWHLVTAVLLVAAALAITSDAWADIWLSARRGAESSQIVLAPLVVAWLTWVRRRRLARCRPTGQWIGPVFVAIGWLLYSRGGPELSQLAWHAGAVIFVTGSLLTVVGAEVLLRLLPAFVAMLFIVPVPGHLRQAVAQPMESATALVIQRALELAGVEFERSGNMLSINGVDVVIAEACNGMRMVFALVMVAYAVSFAMPLRWRVRAVVLLASPILAIACNVMCLLPTVWMYSRGGRWLADLFHGASGWIMLPVSFLLLMGILRLLRWTHIPVTRYTLAYD